MHRRVCGYSSSPSCGPWSHRRVRGTPSSTDPRIFQASRMGDNMTLATSPPCRSTRRATGWPKRQVVSVTRRPGCSSSRSSKARQEAVAAEAEFSKMKAYQDDNLDAINRC